MHYCAHVIVFLLGVTCQFWTDQADKQRERREKSCVFLSTSPLTPPGWSYQEWRPPSDHIWQSLDRGQSCTGTALHYNLSDNTTVLWLCFHCFHLNTSPLGKYSNVLFFVHALFMKNKLRFFSFFFFTSPKAKAEEKRSSGSGEWTIFIEK